MPDDRGNTGNGQNANGSGNGCNSINDGPKLNLNSASAEELQHICEIGPEYAQRIVEERNRRGGFKSAEDLDTVEGFGRETIQLLKEHSTVA